MRLQYLPNIITGIRIALVVPIIVMLLQGNYTWALYLFVLAGFSDAIDGLLARVFGWSSKLGAMLDPVADKCLLMGSFITLGYLGYFSFWLTLLVVARDIWIVFGSLLYRYIIGYFEFKPSLISKINTLLQVLLVGLMLVHLSVYPLSLLFLKAIGGAVLITSVASIIHYTWAWSMRAIKVQKKIINSTQRSAA